MPAARPVRRPEVVARLRRALAATTASLVVATGLVAVGVAGAAPASAATFTAGNVVVLRVGTGAAALSNAATAAFLDEYSPSGTLVQSVPLPTAASGNNRPVTFSGTATSEGALSLAGDGRSLLLAGYTATPGTAAIAGTTSAAVPRVVAKVTADGVVDSTTSFTDAFSANNPRGAASPNGTDLWVVGANSGIRYTTVGASSTTGIATTTAAATTITNFRVPVIADGTLYVSSNSGAATGVNRVTAGLPTSGSSSLSLLTGSLSAYGMVFLDRNPAVAGVDTLYVADDSAATAATPGGIQKFSFDGTTWTPRGSYRPAGEGARGLTASVQSDGTVRLVATTATTTQLTTVTDTAANDATFTAANAVTLATPAANTAFRGVALAPTAPATAPSITAQPQGTSIPAGTSATLSVTAAGTAPLSYQWYQGSTGDVSTPVGANESSFTTPTLTATTSYWVRVTNAAGSVDSETATVTVTAVTSPPTITVPPSSTTISSGGTATLSVTATGTAPLSYQWYEGAAGDTVTPVGTDSASFSTPALTATTSYWVRVTNAYGTADSAAATVTVQAVNAAPTVTPAGVQPVAFTLADAGNPPATRTVTIGDAETAADALTVTVTSSNGAVATGSTTGTGSTRAIAVTPVGVGTATLTVSVSDGQLTSTATVPVAVSAAGPTGAVNLYGVSDASTAVDLGGGYQVVGDDETNVLRVYSRTQSSYPVSTLDLRAAGLALPDAGAAREIDIEASARIGNTVFWVGSQGQNSSGNTRLNRRMFFTTRVSGTGASTTLSVSGSYQGLRDDLVAWDVANGNRYGLAAAAAVAPEPSGLNLEGAEFAPDGTTLYLGFRGPLTSTGKALVVPLTNASALVAANPTTGVTAQFGTALEWDLGGRAVRELRKNAANQYVIVAGPAGASTGAAGEFRLFTWNGNPASAPVPRDGSLDALASSGSIETVVDVPAPLTTSSLLQFVTDSGDTVWYGDGVANKDLPTAEFKKVVSLSVALGTAPACSADDVTIGSVQGTTDVSPVAGQSVTIQGTVVGDYEGASPALRGFYLQGAGDGDPATSDGVFVFNNLGGTSPNSVQVGQVVQVTGTVSEFQGQTQVSATALEQCGRTGTVTPVDLTLPRASANDLEPYEGMLVRFRQTLTVTEHFQLGRFGQVVVSSGGRLRQPTALYPGGDPRVAALQAANDLNQLIVDDGDNAQNADPIVFGRNGNPLSASNTLRGGDTLTDPVGVLSYTWAGNAASGNAFRLRPVNALNGTAQFLEGNPRPTATPAVGGNFKVASANLLNFFNTFGTGACTNGVGGAAADCRGAENTTEYQRQLAKEVAALTALQADVIGVMELENDGYGSGSAIQALVDAMNAVDGAGAWAFVNPDAAQGRTNSAGTDAIKAALLYRTAAVTPLTGLTFTDDASGQFERNPVAQTFRTTNGARVTVVANHFKSKGSCPTATTDPDADQGDGQSCWNVRRTAQANELARWLVATVVPAAGTPDVLIVGDLNSYSAEDPIRALEAAGYVNLAKAFHGDEAYSYVFDGQWGYLDYVLASATLVPKATGAEDVHTNADEPSVLDYNTNFKSAGQITSLYAPDRFRTSDHDPVLAGFDLGAAAGFTGDPATSLTTGTAYSFTFTPSGTAAVTFAVTSGTLPAGLTLSTDGVLSGTPTTDGSSTFEITASNAYGSQARSFTIAVGTAASFTGSPASSLTTGTAYSFSFVPAGTSPVTFAVTAGTLPTGLTVSATGTLSGTPTADGTYSFAVTASNAFGSQDRLFTVTVGAGASFTGTPATSLLRGTAYSFTFTPAGATPVTFAVTSGTLPAGLTLSGAGVLSGTPTADGSSTFEITASNPYGSQVRSFTIAVGTAASFTGSPAASLVLGAPYTVTFTPAGTAPVTFTVTGGSLPAGLTLSASGTLSGTPTTVATSTFTVTASNAFGSQARSFTVAVTKAGSITTVTSSNPGALYRASLTWTATVTPATSGAPTPTGTVQFRVGTTNLGAPVTLVNGSATSPATAALPPGASTITAVYSGSTALTGSTGSFSQSVSFTITITSPAANSSYRAGSTVPIAFTLTDAVGSVPDLVAAQWLLTCRVTVATTGAQLLSPTCRNLAYNTRTKVFTYSWATSRRGTGLVSVNVAVTYPGVLTTQSATRLITLTP